MASAVCDPPCAMPHVSTSVEQLELVVASPWTYAPGAEQIANSDLDILRQTNIMLLVLPSGW